ERQALDHPLSHQHAVEGIVVMEWEVCDRLSMAKPDRQAGEPAGRHPGLDALRQVQPAEPALDRRLPGGYHADGEDLRAGNCPSCIMTQFRIVGTPPDEDVGVEQKPHQALPPNPSKISCGNGSSKSSAINTRPSQPPGRRRTASPTGTSFAFGRPLL